MTLPEVIDYNTERLPFALIQDREEQRFQKAIDTETGAVVGDIRWQLLSGAGGFTWPEAMGPEASPNPLKELGREVSRCRESEERRTSTLKCMCRGNKDTVRYSKH